MKPSLTHVLVVSKNSKYEYERFRFKLSHEELLQKYSSEHANVDAIVEAGEERIVHSRNDDEAKVSADSWDVRPFPRGSTAKICLGKPLTTLHPRDYAA